MSLAVPVPFDVAALGGGWHARLQLRFQVRQGRTRLVERQHEGPLLVQRAFYPESAAGTAGSVPCHVYVLHPPGGVVGGDALTLHVRAEPGTHALLTSPAAGKFYRRSGARVALLQQTLRAEAGTLEWLPQENIFYPDAAVELRTRVHLNTGARFIGWEIGCLGLPTNGLSLGEGAVRQSLEVWLAGTPLLLERLYLGGDALTARWGMAGYSALGTWLAYPADALALARARACVADANCTELTVACTLLDGVLCCRGYARRADQLKQLFIGLWCALRQQQLGCAPVAPRIWST